MRGCNSIYHCIAYSTYYYVWLTALELGRLKFIFYPEKKKKRFAGFLKFFFSIFVAPFFSFFDSLFCLIFGGV